MNQSQMYSNQIDMYINEKHTKNNKRIEELTSKKKELGKTLNRAGFIEKRKTNLEMRRLTSDIRYLKEKNEKLSIVQKGIADCRFAGQTSLSCISQNVIKSLEVVASRLEKEQVYKLQYDLDSAIRDSQIYNPKREVMSAFEKLKREMNNLKINDKRLEDSIARFKSAKLREISSRMEAVELKNLKPLIGIDNTENTNKYVAMDALIQSDDFRNNPDMARIKANYKSIKTQMMIKDKNTKLIESIDSSLSAIAIEAKQSGTDFSKLIADLNSYKKEANIKLTEASRYLSKFNITTLEKELDSNKEKYGYQERYKILAYEMEKAKSEGNLTKAEEIKKKMAELGKGHSDSELMELQREASNKVFNENSQKQMVDNASDKTFEEEQLEINARSNNEIETRRKSIDEKEEQLRQIAIEKLKYDNVSLDDDNREDLIQNEMKNISRLSRMTPEQRRIEAGNNNPNDNFLYTDEMLGFSSKEFKRAEEEIKRDMKMQASTIKGEYLKYYAKIDNKEDAMTYSEFAAMRYNYANINEDLLDEESRQEIEEAGRSR